MHRARSYQERIRNILNEWDPIGIRGFANIDDEYDSYIGPVYRLLVTKAQVSELFDLLRKGETEAMGLRGNKQHTMSIAERLVSLEAEFEMETHE